MGELKPTREAALVDKFNFDNDGLVLGYVWFHIDGDEPVVTLDSVFTSAELELVVQKFKEFSVKVMELKNEKQT